MFLILAFGSARLEDIVAQEIKQPSPNPNGPYLDSWSPVPKAISQAVNHPSTIFLYSATHLIDALKSESTLIKVIYFAEQDQNPIVADLPSNYRLIYEIQKQDKSFYLGVEITIGYFIFSVSVDKMIYLSDLEMIKKVLGIETITDLFWENYHDLQNDIDKSDDFQKIAKFIPSFFNDLSGFNIFDKLSKQPVLVYSSTESDEIYPSKVAIKGLSTAAGFLTNLDNLKVLHFSIENPDLLITRNSTFLDYIFELSGTQAQWHLYIRVKYSSVNGDITLDFEETSISKDLEALTKRLAITLEPDFSQSYPNVLKHFLDNRVRSASRPSNKPRSK